MIDYKILIQKAQSAMQNSYSPYSHFKVGACVLTSDGEYSCATNVENASYPNGSCAETTTLNKMISEGYKKEDAVAFAIVGQAKRPISPCGLCRQVMSELLPQDTPVVLSTLSKEYVFTTVEKLLPYSFNDGDL